MRRMKRPVIGLTTDSSDDDKRYMSTMSYAAAIEKAGGLPLLLPYGVDHALIPQYVDLLDGICFTGGNDTKPVRYGAERHPKNPPLGGGPGEIKFAVSASGGR